MGNPRNEAVTFPKFDGTAVHRLLCFLDGFLVVIAQNDLRRRCDMTVFVDGVEAVLGHAADCSHP